MEATASDAHDLGHTRRHAPRDQVWAVLSDIAKAGRWNSAWSRIEFASNQTHGPGTRFRAETADGQTFEFEVTDLVGAGIHRVLAGEG